MIVIDISFLLRTAPPGRHDRQTMTRLLAEQDRSLNAEVEWRAGAGGGGGGGGAEGGDCAGGRTSVYRAPPPKLPIHDQV